MTYEKTIDVDCYNDEQRPFNYDYDCLEYWAYLKEKWLIDTSDEEYEAWRDEQMERELELCETN
jgi:hypothetical protein